MNLEIYDENWKMISLMNWDNRTLLDFSVGKYYKTEILKGVSFAMSFENQQNSTKYREILIYQENNFNFEFKQKINQTTVSNYISGKKINKK